MAVQQWDEAWSLADFDSHFIQIGDDVDFVDGIYCIDVYYFQQLVKFHCIACVTILG